MPFRAGELYISRENRRRLKYIAEAQDPDPVTGKQPTRDEVGDALLTKIIAQDHPEAMEGEKEVTQLEKSVVEKIRAKRTAPAPVMSSEVETSP